MKAKLYIIAASVLVAGFTSCKKNSSSPTSPTTGASLVRVQQGADPAITNDTVYLIKYDGNKKITSIIDSLNQDTLTATYDASGNLAAVNETWGNNATFTYDGSGLLTQLDYMIAGTHDQYVYEYTGGVLSKKTFNSNLGSGSVTLQGYATYTFTNGNITELKEFNASGTQIADLTCTYGTQTNALKSLSLFNYGNLLGLDDIANIDTYFNKNTLTGMTTSGVGVSSVITFNGSQQPVKIVSTDIIAAGVFTWAFSYK